MINIKELIVFIFVALFVLNAQLGGAVWDATTEFSTNEERKEAMSDITCAAGHLIYGTTTEVFGFDLPVPKYTGSIILFILLIISDSGILFAAFGAAAITIFYRIFTGVEWKFLFSILIFIGLWIIIKAYGFYLIQSVGETCVLWSEEEVSGAFSMFDLGALGTGFWGLKILWGIRK